MYGSNSLKSSFALVNISCGIHTSILKPLNLRNITYKLGGQSLFSLPNFTSSNPSNCPIISHILVGISSTNSSSSVTLTEGSS